MRYLTAAEMREVDRRCIEGVGIPGAVLMNNAGAAVFREIPGGPVGIVCGKGNNGGDGFVVARLALLAGYSPEVIVLAPEDSFQGDAATFLRAYRNLGGEIRFAQDEKQSEHAVQDLAHCRILVDAILGTGIRGEVLGTPRAAIEAWPHVPSVAVDLPSGLDADTGEIGGACIRAGVTVTFQFPKRGFENPRAKPYVGRLVIADIGIPPLCADDTAWQDLLGRSGR